MRRVLKDHQGFRDVVPFRQRYRTGKEREEKTGRETGKHTVKESCETIKKVTMETSTRSEILGNWNL